MWARYFMYYFMVITFLGYLLMGLDKHKAMRNQWRIPEKVLFLVAALGGSVGCIVGMQVFRHKTKHWYFQLGMPLILLAQIALAAGVWYWYHFVR